MGFVAGILVGIITGITTMAVVAAKRSASYKRMEMVARSEARSGHNRFKNIFDQMYGERNW